MSDSGFENLNTYLAQRPYNCLDTRSKQLTSFRSGRITAFLMAVGVPKFTGVPAEIIRWKLESELFSRVIESPNIVEVGDPF